jgi:putative heme-binding domain-containing protein
VIFERACASCHRLGGIGNEVGPDLAALTDTSPDALLTAILDPNREVDARYAVYVAALKDGRVVDGLIVAETASALTLKRQGGQMDTVLRADIDELTTSGRSLMPEGLENDLKPADLADVIAFVARPPKTLTGNRPQTVAPRPDGSIRLAASTAEIYGPSLIFEPEFGNLGYWQNEADRASWTFRVDRPATFTVSLDFACDNAVAGNAYLLRIDDQTTRGTVAGTGTWSEYRSIFLREVRLGPGDHRLEFRPAGPVRGALADVRTMVLTPREPAAGVPSR